MKWRIRNTPHLWIVEEWDGLRWERISIAFLEYSQAYFYMHANAVVECSKDSEYWKL